MVCGAVKACPLLIRRFDAVMKKRQCIAMLLAGGQGTRLYALTNKIAKPAVSFGGKYRIIDFTLSNCTNSNIDVVGVLTQYQPLILNEYLGNGEPWDLDRTHGGLHSLSPYQAKTGREWYKGTANAIYQNLHFLQQFDSEHVLILSGDHIYKMDYSKMLAQHIANDADCTIAAIGVAPEEASRFGILAFDKKHAITSFEEKPAQPKSNYASMGIYIFKKQLLVDELTADEANSQSSNDFGKDIIPKLLSDNRRLFAYPFDGYWKDVGTLTSLWEANMDLLGDKPLIDLADPSFKIYGRNEQKAPSYIGADASVHDSLMTTGCEIEGKVVNSIIGEGVSIGKGTVVSNSIIMNNAVIGDNVTIDYGIIDENVVIQDSCVLGDQQSSKVRTVLVGRDTVVAKGSVVASDSILEI